ncbi:MAG TPA: endolytic transglycosylase MltG [Candidatus Sulfotelmatobacter sp.]|jgi:UPF0755 protein|nr:endolytic transglycosylase MltG [Candidatus Sulfotelmatobacter sp.]
MTRWIIRLAAVLVIAGMAGGGFLLWAKSRLTAPGPTSTATTVVIEHGSGSQAIASQLAEAGVIDSPWLFLLEIRLTGHLNLKAGEYAFPASVSMAAIIDMMHRGQVVVHKVTIAEGLTVAQVMAELRQADGLTGRVMESPDEGSLLPQTYFFSLGDSRDALVSRMSRGMNETLDELWPKRKQGLLLANKMEALILASVVERETGIAAERPHIAAVFLNRLRLKMRLQSDPTVIYAVSNGEGVLERPLTRDDLAFPSPYNTYASDGLPAGPICNPGRASIQAVLHPADSDDLYFVADGSGGHVFAKTLTDHNRNVAKWRTVQQGKK